MLVSGFDKGRANFTGSIMTHQKKEDRRENYAS